MPAAALRTPAPVVTPQPPAPAPAPRARAATPVVRQPAGWPPAVRLSRAGAATPAVATKRLLGAQTALRVSSPNDPAEHEATTTASKIVRMELPAYVHGASGGAYRQLQREQARPIRAGSADPAITRRAARHGLAWRLSDGAVQRQAQGPASATPSIASAIQASANGGTPLPMGVRRFMEPRFRANFGDVRIHTDDRAAALNRQLNARAFTVGSHIFFGRDAFQPETQAGQELIAHELTHTVQQGAAVQRSTDVSVTQQSPTQVQRLGLSDILDGLAELAANVPGFTLLTLIIGRNPINMRVVERNFTNLLRGFMGLIPGGEILFQVLNRYGIVERLGAWVEQQVNAIGISYDYIRERFTEFTDSLSWSDIFSPGDVWRRAQNIFSEPITRIRNFVSRLIDQAITWLKETFMQPLSDFCRQIPGYTLVTVLLGRDPFTNAPVERSALNVVRAFAEFIPGGIEKVNQLVESRALQRAYEWFIQETQTRNLTWARVTGTFAQAWNSLRLEDVLHPIDTLQRMVTMFRPLMTDLVSFAGAALMKLLELIFEAVMGAGGARILAILKRARDTFLMIIRNPVGFLGNLLRAVGQGVRQFMTNILRHLQQGVIAWLTGPVARAGIQMPERWDLRGIIWFVLQILGLTWDRIRQKLVRLMGERAVAMLETGFQLIQEIREKGLVQALRDRVTEFFGQLREAALGSIRSFIQQRLVMAGITQLLSLLSPVGAVIQAIIKTYTTIQFFIQRISQILDLVESIVNSIAAIASGSIGAAANFIEQTMARTIPVILDFLARFIGLGDVGGQVQRTIQGLQARVDQMLDRAVDWIRSMAQRLATAVVQAGVPNDPNERLRLAGRDAIAAARRLGGRVTRSLLNPVLNLIKLRYGLREIEPYEQGGSWWVRATINPTVDLNTGVMIDPADANQTQGVLDLYRGIYLLDKVANYNQLNPQQLADQLAREEDFSEAVYTILGITRLQAPSVTAAQRAAAAQQVIAEMRTARTITGVRPWWNTTPRPNLFLTMLQRFVNMRSEFQEELQTRRRQELARFTFTDIPFISTTKNPARAAQFAFAAVVAAQPPAAVAAALQNPSGKVIGKVFVYLFRGNDLVSLQAADIRYLASVGGITPQWRYSMADKEITFTGSIPTQYRIGTIIVLDRDSIAGIANQARSIAASRATAMGGLIPWT